MAVQKQELPTPIKPIGSMIWLLHDGKAKQGYIVASVETKSTQNWFKQEYSSKWEPQYITIIRRYAVVLGSTYDRPDKDSEMIEGVKDVFNSKEDLLKSL